MNVGDGSRMPRTATGAVPMTAAGVRQVTSWRREDTPVPTVGRPNGGVAGCPGDGEFFKDVAKLNAEVLTQVRWERIGKVGVIVLNRRKAKKNAYTEVMRNEICFCLEELANKDKDVRAVILTGTSYDQPDAAKNAQGYFCFGADLSLAGKENPSAVEGDVPTGPIVNLSNYRDGGGRVSLAVLRCLKPVIAAINGTAVGVGMTMTLGCDISVAVKSAKVGFVFARRGLMMEGCSSTMLSRCVGHKKALELVLTGRVFRAEDAPPGLFNYTCDTAAEVHAKALALAEEIAAHTAPISSSINRHMVIRNAHVSPEEAHLAESKAIGFAVQQKDFREGVGSFLTKRPPQWSQDPYLERPDWFPWWRRVEVQAHL
eukprot:TRINITY_DN3195_c0_g1_i1.p2 TRINITY_DN3195_c0_g1~~TRINITY_DN3195_c0_g1_i1.p2  ORF type:complete len:372 (+),score=137.78 TRINITY_DN3195_c0_g1_i1:48-1163(+)